MSEVSYNIFCPAKINLFLEVTGRRPDGYHELATLFAKLKFGDNISLTLTPNTKTEINVTLTGPYAGVITAGPDNLVYKAAQRFFEYANITAKCDITLDKQVPTGAGLGGGSSDAGCLLRTLCNHYKIDFKNIIPLAAKLGADVPLFLYDEAVLKGEGIGDKLTPVKVAGAMPHVVLSYPNVHIPTKNVFAGLSLPKEEEVLTSVVKLDKIIFALSEGKQISAWKDLIYNRLEEVVFPAQREVLDLKVFMNTQAAPAAMMSGSGSTVFALFDLEQDAVKLTMELKNRGSVVFLTQLWEGLK
ncbi:4-diphosphocytidyl-2-C-methyl-D-erythritol kinase [Elusimicrobium simillimum]|uniref:4-(cytidine 5'-diphospho)-2-C-methyl-D-erythritol kinase n=1 Tax=Elusimicrobium simillimum TaxID=3143438 RepID=UPI003C6FDF37